VALGLVAARDPQGFRVLDRANREDDATGCGNATVVGISTVYFLQTPAAPEVCQAETPLTYQDIAVYRIAAGATFNLGSWSGTGGGL